MLWENGILVSCVYENMEIWYGYKIFGLIKLFYNMVSFYFFMFKCELLRIETVFIFIRNFYLELVIVC